MNGTLDARVVVVGGHHLCATYQDAADRATVLDQFRRGAIDEGYRLFELGRDETTALYGDRPITDPDGLVADFASLAERAVSDGYRGLAVTTDATGLVLTPAARAAFARVEHLADRLIRSGGTLAGLCLYDAEELGADALLELGALHERMIPNDAPFHVCASGLRGLRLDGELDLGTVEALQAVLGVTLPSEPGTWGLDVGGVDFIDHRSLTVLDRIAAGRQQQVELCNADSIIGRLISIAQLDRLCIAEGL